MLESQNFMLKESRHKILQIILFNLHEIITGKTQAGKNPNVHQLVKRKCGISIQWNVEY